MSAPILEAREVSEASFGVEDLHRVSIQITPGVVQNLVGENGAGTSLLI